ncbi:hypothetical protein ACJJTC_012140 [Scirpophaga incertulas]
MALAFLTQHHSSPQSSWRAAHSPQLLQILQWIIPGRSLTSPPHAAESYKFANAAMQSYIGSFQWRCNIAHYIPAMEHANLEAAQSPQHHCCRRFDSIFGSFQNV